MPAESSAVSSLYLALLHYPVFNKQKEVIASSVTNLDLHDIARAARTFGVRQFFVVTPLKDQQDLVRSIAGHWETGAGAVYNPDRQSALRTICLTDTLEQTMEIIRQGSCGSQGDRDPEYLESSESIGFMESGASACIPKHSEPQIIATTARVEENIRDRVVSFPQCRDLLQQGKTVLLCLGTAWGLTPEFMERADAILTPIHGPTEYNHLSVRSAAAIILDRLLARQSG